MSNLLSCQYPKAIPTIDIIIYDKLLNYKIHPDILIELKLVDGDNIVNFDGVIEKLRERFTGCGLESPITNIISLGDTKKSKDKFLESYFCLEQKVYCNYASCSVFLGFNFMNTTPDDILYVAYVFKQVIANDVYVKSKNPYHGFDSLTVHDLPLKIVDKTKKLNLVSFNFEDNFTNHCKNIISGMKHTLK